jgi:hypothetical protein
MRIQLAIAKPLLRALVWHAFAFTPSLLLAYGSWMFTQNHFYGRAPYLYDSGWFSSIVFRNGVLPKNPNNVLNEVPYYWGWHVSPIISLGSVASYFYSADRIDWYSTFQACIYAPIGLAVGALPAPRTRSVSNALMVFVSSLAFSLNGQVLVSLGYPHFEIFASAGCALLLGAIATDRRWLAWVGLAMAIATREDGGGHAGMMALAALACDYTGKPFRMSRERVATLACVAVASTLITVVLQKRFFETVNAWEIYLVGKPPFSHLSLDVVVHRFRTLGEKAGFVWLPLLTTIAISVAKRDARFLLGWVFSTPWFLLNFTAKQQLKSGFELYTGFPFVGALFWVGAYGCARSTDDQTGFCRRPLVLLSVVSFVSTIGAWYSYPNAIRSLAQDCLVASKSDKRSLRDFFKTISQTPSNFDHLLIDDAVAAWAVDTATRKQLVQRVPPPTKDEITSAPGILYFDQSQFSPSAYSFNTHAGFTECGALRNTLLMFCGRDRRLVPPTFDRVDPLIRALSLADGASRTQTGIRVHGPLERGIQFYGGYFVLAPGTYTALIDLQTDRCIDHHANASIEIFVHGLTLCEKNIERGARTYQLPFEVTGNLESGGFEIRGWSGSCAYEVTRARFVLN